MISVTCRRPFSELGDQQLLDQTRRLAANQRCIDVHILDHLDEIDRRGLALRRGFSSLFDYAVRELHFSDAAAQRRIQAMRLCRRHGWVRACLQSGALSMTSAGQLETTFAGAERAERQSHTGHRNVGQDRGHDQDHDSAGGTRQLGLPAAPGEADEQGERGHRSAPGFAPPAGECSGDVRERAHRSAPGGAPPAGECSGEVAAGNTSAAPVASRAGAQAPGTGHAGAPLPLSELNGNASPFPAPSCATVAAHGAGAGADAGSAAPSSDEDLAPQLLPPPDVPASASASTPVPAPIVAPAESRHTAARAPEPLRDDPFAELSPGTVSAAPLLHPQRQRELIEQAAGMSTRQVASLLAAAAPEVLPPRDTLRATAPDRYTLKVSIDQECEQGLRLLKDLMSHVDPRMSWGDLVARLVRDAVARHDPRGGGRGQRRKGADSAGASPRRAPKETRGRGCGRAGSARRRGFWAGAESDRCCRGAGGPGSAQRRRYFGAAVGARDTVGWRRRRRRSIGHARRYFGTAVGTRGTVGWRPHRRSSIGRARRYFGAAVGTRDTVGWRRRRRRSIGHARRYFGAGVGARGTVGWRPHRRSSIGRARRYFGAAVGTRGTVGWRPRWWRSIGHVRCYFGAGVGARGTVGWRPHRRSSIGRARHYFGAAVGARAAVGWRPRRRRSIGRIRRYFGAAVGARGTVGWRPRRWRSIGHARRYFGTGVGTWRVPLAADRAARQMEQRAGPRRLASLRGQAYRAGRSPLRRRSRCSAGCPTADRQTHQPEQRRTRPANLFTAATNPRHGATFPRRSGATSGYATVDAAVIVIRSPGAAAPRPICCRSTTCCPSHRAVARRRPTWLFAALLITECATATVRLLRRSPRCSASCARLARRSTALADGLPVARRGYPSQRREPTVHLRYRLCRPRAGRCRCAHARRCRGLPSTIACRLRRSQPSLHLHPGNQRIQLDVTPRQPQADRSELHHPN